MTTENSTNIALPLSAAVTLAIEHWRLSKCLAHASGDAAGPARHALRRIGDVLKQCEIEVIDMIGKPFDAGVAAEVIDRVEDNRLAPGQMIVDETISPLVMWRGQVAKAAQIIARVGVLAQEAGEA